MDIVAHYSPPSIGTSSVHAAAHKQSPSNPRNGQHHETRLGEIDAQYTAQASSSSAQKPDSHKMTAQSSGGWKRQKGTLGEGVDDAADSAPYTSSTFHRSVQIALMEPIGSMSLSPANRDVVLAARKGLFILDLESPYDQPRFLPHLTTWVPADVQWNPHPARANWVASTSNDKLLVWNLDRPVAPQVEPVLSGSNTSAAGISPSNSAGMRRTSTGFATPTSYTGTLPQPPAYGIITAASESSTSRLSSISHVLHAHTRAITDINWSPFHPEILASCGIDTWAWAWDLRDHSRPKQGYSTWNAAMTQVKWNRATQHRLATSCDNKVLIWDDRKGALPLATIEAHENKIYGVDWSRDTSLGLSRLITCSLDGSVKWWDLDSPAAQQAIANRQLVTEPETTIETQTPVWRSRHLPFGNGVMTLPQRGDTSLSMWSKEQLDEPIHRFEGHSDVVKEYLIRTQGGSDRENDDRQFQLITWSKDQTLRLWPISQEVTKAAGHKRNAPIRVLQTRIGAENISYRAPPSLMNHAKETSSLPPPSPATSPSVTSSSPASFAVPSDAARSLLNGKSSANARVINPSASPLSGSHGRSPLDKRPFMATSLTRSAEMMGFLHRDLQYSAGNSPSALRDGRQRKQKEPRDLGRHSGMSAPKPQSQNTQRTGTLAAPTRKSEGKKMSKKKHPHLVSHKAASQSFMTRGTMGQSGHGRLGAAQKGNALRIDAVGWIAGVRMGNEEARSQLQQTDEADLREIGGYRIDDSKDAANTARDKGSRKDEGQDHEETRGTAQVLSEEIMSISKRLDGADFEKIDVSARTCSVTCTGPWAGRNVPCFLRITFSFPISYPAKPPDYELEHNASVALKTRAFLLRNIAAILAEHAKRDPPSPSMEAVISFLLGDTLPRHISSSAENSALPHWLIAEDAEQSDDEVEPTKVELKMQPRRCGATFARNGTLVIFAPRKGAVGSDNVANPPSASGASDSRRAGLSGGGARFLQSYTALAGAMSSLARLAKDGVSVQDLDVVQLMGDQDFFAKRLQTQQRVASSKPSSAMRTSNAATSETTDTRRADNRLSAHTLLQSRLKLTSSPASRSSSRLRPAGRARSASPMALPSAKARFGNVLHGFADPRPRFQYHDRSQVMLYDVSGIVGVLAPPPFLRRRSNSTPAPQKPPSARDTRTAEKVLLLALPERLRQQSTAKEPAGISASRRDASEADGELARGLENSTNVRIMEMDDAEAANFIASVVADGSGTLYDENRRSGNDDESEDGYGVPSDLEGSDSDDDSDSSNDDEMSAEQLMRETQRDSIHPFAEGVLDTLIWTIPFGFLYLMMDIMIQQQYASHPSVWSEVQRMVQALPMLTIFIYYTAIKPSSWPRTSWASVVLQLFLLISGTVCGCGFLWVYTRSASDIVMRRTAPLGTLWMYSIVRLDLSLVVLSLSIVYGFTKLYRLPLFD